MSFCQQWQHFIPSLHVSKILVEGDPMEFAEIYASLYQLSCWILTRSFPDFPRMAAIVRLDITTSTVVFVISSPAAVTLSKVIYNARDISTEMVISKTTMIAAIDKILQILCTFQICQNSVDEELGPQTQRNCQYCLYCDLTEFWNKAYSYYYRGWCLQTDLCLIILNRNLIAARNLLLF